MKNKKGEENLVVNNVTGLVLAIIAIFIIIAFIYVAITQITRDNELEAAKLLAERIKSRIDLMEVGQSVNITLQSSKYLEGWFLVGWSKENISKPDKCFFSKSCFCVCKGKTTDDCQKKGICRDFDIENILVNSYLPTADPSGQTYVEFGSGAYSSESTIMIQGNLSEIIIPPNFFVLEIEKNRDKIVLSEKSRWIAYLKEKIK